MNRFLCLLGKSEPERLLTAIHDKGPISTPDLERECGRLKCDWYLPVLVRRGFAARADGMWIATDKTKRIARENEAIQKRIAAKQAEERRAYIQPPPPPPAEPARGFSTTASPKRMSFHAFDRNDK